MQPPLTLPQPTLRGRGDVPHVRVVVVTYSPGPALERLLVSLPSAVSEPYEVVLADNGSVDGAPEGAVEAHGVQLLRTGGNIGYGAAANAGSAQAAGPFLLVCNPDLTFAPGAVDELLAATERWPHAGAFGPAVRQPDGTLYPSARALPVVGHGIGHALLARVWPANPWTRAYRRDDVEVAEREAGWLSGSCLLLRRAAFEEVGGFDRGYFMYFEDVDLGDRLARAGWSSVYVPSAEVEHVGGTTTRRHARAMLTAHHASAYRYLAGRYRPPLRWLLWLGLKLRYGLLLARTPRDPRTVPPV